MEWLYFEGVVIGFSVGELFGSIFLNTAVMGVADVMANCILIGIMRHCPRQILTSLIFALLGLCLIASSVMRGFYFDQTRLADMIMMIMAKFFASSEFFLVTRCCIFVIY